MIRIRRIKSDKVYLLVLSPCFGGANFVALKIEETGAAKKKSKK